jgi:ubiquitin-protein ligase
VCLSILGTWSGESEDEWRSSYSINYVLSAIQSLIMTAKPYHNEPGYEEVPTRALALAPSAEVQC